MSLIRKHGAVLQAWACLDLVLILDNVSRAANNAFAGRMRPAGREFETAGIEDTGHNNGTKHDM